MQFESSTSLFPRFFIHILPRLFYCKCIKKALRTIFPKSNSSFFKIMSSNIFQYFNKSMKNKHLKYGLPFLCFIGLSLAVIRECATVRYQFRQTKVLDREELRSLGYKVRDRPETLEEAYEKYLEIDIDNWENKRGPRLWDETPQN